MALHFAELITILMLKLVRIEETEIKRRCVCISPYHLVNNCIIYLLCFIQGSSKSATGGADEKYAEDAARGNATTATGATAAVTSSGRSKIEGSLHGWLHSVSLHQ